MDDSEYCKSNCEFYEDKCPIIKGEDLEARKLQERDFCFSGNHENCYTRRALIDLEGLAFEDAMDTSSENVSDSQ